MRFNKKNWKPLHCLETGMLGSMPIYEEDLMFFQTLNPMFTGNWKENCYRFKKDINIMSKSFCEACNKSSSKLLLLFEDATKNDAFDIKIEASFIVGDYIYNLYYEINKGSDDNEIFFYCFHKTGRPLFMYIDSCKKEIWQTGWISQSLAKYHNLGKDKDKAMHFLMNHFITAVNFYLFKHYAQVETKLLPENKKTSGIDCEYGHVLNEINLKMTYLTSTWFTNLIQSEGFNVRGHFRFQVCGTGFKDRKLIWIAEFKKEGYRRQADITKQTT